MRSSNTMAGAGATSPFIKDEPEDNFFTGGHQRYMGASQQPFNMSNQHFNQFGGGSIDPNDLMTNNTMSTQGAPFGSPFQNNNHGGHSSNANATFPKGFSTLDDDDLLDTLPHDSHHSNNGMSGPGQDFNSLNDFDFSPPQSVYSNNGAPLSIDQHINGYSNTPEGDPIQSPFVHNFGAMQFRQMQQQQQGFGGSLQSPISYGSPLASEMHSGSIDNGYMASKSRPRLSQTMQRKSSNTRSPLTPKTPGLAVQSLNLNGPDAGGYPSQPIRTSHHGHSKTLSGEWDHTPSSMTSFPGSQFGSPMQAGMHPNPQISDMLKTGSLPPKLGATSTQEMKRRRRRESHNLVERRRRDNINERIQELSHLVPMHRLEDEKVRKAIQNNSPLSPTLTGLSTSPPNQATSGLAGPGARRATGNITQGIPLEEKDKGPNKGDILNGAVSWTRDLMWMLYVKMQQQEELANLISELGGQYPFEVTEDEKRMQSELMSAMKKNVASTFSYSRCSGSGLRVPEYTDHKGDPLGGDGQSLSPDDHSGAGDAGQTGAGAGQYWSGHNSGGSGPASISFKEEDEYSMDLN